MILPNHTTDYSSLLLREYGGTRKHCRRVIRTLDGTWAGQVGLRHPPAKISIPFLDLENFFIVHCSFRAPTSGAYWGSLGLLARHENGEHSPTAIPPFHPERRERKETSQLHKGQSMHVLHRALIQW